MTKHTLLLVVALGTVAFASCGGGSSAPSNATEFCKQTESILCDKVFQCVPAAARDADFVAVFGNNPSECKAMSNTDCADATTTCPTFNSATAKTCVDKLGPLTCADVGDSNIPAECEAACM